MPRSVDQTEALRRIEANLVTQSPFLDLGDLSLREIPQTIDTLKHLEILALGKWAIGADGQWRYEILRPAQSFPDLAPLIGLANLTSLDLSWCTRVKDLTSLAELLELRELYLSGCNGVSALKPLERLTNLARLDLSWCERLEDLTPLAELLELRELNLSGCKSVSALQPLERLTNLARLDLSWCERVEDLTPLSELLELRELDLSECKSVSDLKPLERLPKLARLALSECREGLSFAPIRPLLEHLETLELSQCRFADLPLHLTSGDWRRENVVERIRQHYQMWEAHEQGQDTECTLLVVGNGAVGKTSFVRYLLGQDEAGVVSTHGIHQEQWETHVQLEGNSASLPVRVNLVDFGRRALASYHTAHRLFFPSGAIVVLVWNPHENERSPSGAEEEYSDGKHSLRYWIDQISSIDEQARILIVRNKADLDEDRPDPQPDWHEQLAGYREAIDSGRIGLVRLSLRDLGDESRRGRSRRHEEEPLQRWLRSAVVSTLGSPDARLVSLGRAKVREEFRRWQRENDKIVRANERTPPKFRQELPYKLLGFDRFEQLVGDCCRGVREEDPDSVLDWLRRTGVVFWDESLFEGRILIDYRWLIEGISSLYRPRPLGYLKFSEGRFTLANLSQWIWTEVGYSRDEQKQLLEFMEFCGLCFLLLHGDEVESGGPVYVAPDFLPERGQSIWANSTPNDGL